MTFSQWLRQLDFSPLTQSLLLLLAALPCLVIHEYCHGLAAYRLGDTTAKRRGRLTLNPLRHIDWLGLAAMVFCRFGWAKPVPIDLQNLRHPRRDTALVALAGPVSNFLFAGLVLIVCALTEACRKRYDGSAAVWLELYLYAVAQLSVGLGLFNLLPIPPLDGSKVLLSFLPEKVFGAILKYERYGSVLLLLLLWTGVLDTPLVFLRSAILNAMVSFLVPTFEKIFSVFV